MRTYENNTLSQQITKLEMEIKENREKLLSKDKPQKSWVSVLFEMIYPWRDELHE